MIIIIINNAQVISQQLCSKNYIFVLLWFQKLEQWCHLPWVAVTMVFVWCSHWYLWKIIHFCFLQVFVHDLRSAFLEAAGQRPLSRKEEDNLKLHSFPLCCSSNVETFSLSFLWVTALSEWGGFFWEPCSTSRHVSWLKTTDFSVKSFHQPYLALTGYYFSILVSFLLFFFPSQRLGNDLKELFATISGALS